MCVFFQPRLKRLVVVSIQAQVKAKEKYAETAPKVAAAVDKMKENVTAAVGKMRTPPGGGESGAAAGGAAASGDGPGAAKEENAAGGGSFPPPVPDSVPAWAVAEPVAPIDAPAWAADGASAAPAESVGGTGDWAADGGGAFGVFGGGGGGESGAAGL